MKKGLHIAESFALPLDAQTSTIVVYGGKGMGKTNFEAVLCEELAAQNLRFSCLDPLDVSWGLAYGRTKTEAGLPILILGGPHGNLPIYPDAGAIVADFVADEAVSTVVVLRRPSGEMWTNGERIRFTTDYFTRLYARQGERRLPLMQIVDEAGRFVPQMAMKGDVEIARCIGAIEQMVEWGRNVGVGVCLITQRSARMNKSVSELADCMVAFRTVGPNSIDAIVDWLGEHVPKAAQKDWIEQLRKLPIGHALLVSPGWLEHEGIVAIRERRTFDSSKTPKPGESLKAPGKATEPDLDKYAERMQSTIERAKADDPKELRKTIQKLEAEVKGIRSALGKSEFRDLQEQEANLSKHVAERERQIATRDRENAALQAEVERLEGRINEAMGFIDTLLEAGSRIRRTINAPKQRAVAAPAAQTPRPIFTTIEPEPRAPNTEHRPDPPEPNGEIPDGIGKGHLAILTAIARFEALGVAAPKRDHVGALAKYSPGGGTFQKYVGRLNALGLVSYPTGRAVALTEAGRAICPPPDGKATLAEYQEAWMGLVPGAGHRTLLRRLIDVYPATVSREWLGEQTGYTSSGGTFQKYIGKLNSLGLVRYPSGGEVAATDLLFPEGLR